MKSTRSIMFIIIVLNYIIGVLEFQKYVINTLTNIKFDIKSLMNIVQTNHMDINTLLSNSKNISASSIISIVRDGGIDFNKYFPLKNEEDIHVLYSKLTTDDDFKAALVS